MERPTAASLNATYAKLLALAEPVTEDGWFKILADPAAVERAIAEGWRVEVVDGVARLYPEKVEPLDAGL